MNLSACTVSRDRRASLGMRPATVPAKGPTSSKGNAPASEPFLNQERFSKVLQSERGTSPTLVPSMVGQVCGRHALAGAVPTAGVSSGPSGVGPILAHAKRLQMEVINLCSPFDLRCLH